MKIIAFEGIDSAGKETQTKLLTEELRMRGFNVVSASFPRYALPIGGLIKDWLNNKINIAPVAIHMLYEADRVDFQQAIEQLEDKGFDFLILDRYVLSNLAFVMAKGLDVEWFEILQKPVRKPDLTFILDVSSETSLSRKKIKDVHENDTQLLNRTRVAYDCLKHTLSDVRGEDWLIETIDANQEPELVHTAILSYLNNVLEVWNSE